MELNQTKTKPSTRSVLRFNENEVIEALKMLAVKQGYRISSNGKYFIWYPSRSSKTETSLVVDADGSEFSIKDN